MIFLKTTDTFKTESPNCTVTIHLAENNLYFWKIDGELEAHQTEHYGKWTRHESIDSVIDYWTNAVNAGQFDFTFKITPTRFGADWGELTVTAPSYDKAVDLLKERVEREGDDFADYDLLTVSEAK